TEADRETLAAHGAVLGASRRQLIGHERYYGYIACTRARRGVVFTYGARDAHDRTLNPSPFLAHLQRLFPALPIETFSADQPWQACEHASELIAPLFKAQRAKCPAPGWEALAKLPALAALVEDLRY